MTRKATIEFDVEGAAFQTEDGRTDLHAVSDTLTLIKERIRDGEAWGGIRDGNGNTVGAFRVDT